MSIVDINEFTQNLNKKEAIICLDVGTSKIGIAVSDRHYLLSNPLKIIKVRSRKQVYSELNKVLTDIDSRFILIGLPLQADGEEGDACIMIKNFAKELSDIDQNLIISFYDERYSTSTAQEGLRSLGVSRKKRDQNDDMVAASIILNNYLVEYKS